MNLKTIKYKNGVRLVPHVSGTYLVILPNQEGQTQFFSLKAAMLFAKSLQSEDENNKG